jgi:hypothetical protein
LVECIRPILPSIRNTPYGKRIQSKLAREDASFSNYGPPGPGNGYSRGGGGGGGGPGGYRGGPPGGHGGPGGYQRHLGRPQLQHINALTEVYGSQGPFIPQGGPPNHGHHGGMAYHAPGPDGQPWLHLRGHSGGGPAPNWNVQGSEGGTVTPPNGMMGGGGGMDGMGGMGMWSEQGQGMGQVGGFMPYQGAPHPHAMM